MGEAHILDIGHERLGERVIVEEAVVGATPPGAEMHLVDRNRRRNRVGGRGANPPRLVAPGMVRQPMNARCRRRRQLLLETERVGLERQELAVRPEELVFVEPAAGDAGQEDFPQAGFLALAQRVAATVPVVEISDHAHPAGIGRKHCKAGAGDALAHRRVGAELLIEPQVPPLGKEIVVDLAEHRREAIGILLLEGMVAFDEAQAVVGTVGPRQHGRKQPIRVGADQFGDFRAGRRVDQQRARHAGTEHPHDPMAAIEPVGTENGEGIAMAAADQRLDRGLGKRIARHRRLGACRRHGTMLRRRRSSITPRTGMESQPGRLAAS